MPDHTGLAATRLVQDHHPDGVNADDHDTCECGWTAEDLNERWVDHLVHLLAVDGLLAERRPYPTTHAYEQACRTIRAKQSRIDAIRAVLDAADDWEHLTPGEVHALSTALHGPAAPAVTPPDPSGRITDAGSVEPFHPNDTEVPHA